MSAAIHTRLATLDDLPFVGQDRYLPERIVQRKITEEDVFVAEIEGRLVGYLRLEFLWSMIPYIAIIQVLPDKRRQGVGTALLAFISERLRQAGQTMLYSSSQADEAAPQAWHRRMGFEECGLIAGINDGVGEVFFRKRV